MNRQEFEIWQQGIYETINESSIIGLSQIKGDVGTHNNRTPDQVKANNEKKASLRAKAMDMMKKGAQKAGETIKNGAKAVAQKTGDAINKVKDSLASKHKDHPIGLAGVNKQKPNSDSKPVGLSGVKNQSTSDTANKFAQGVHNAQSNPAPQTKTATSPANNKNSKGADGTNNSATQPNAKAKTKTQVKASTTDNGADNKANANATKGSSVVDSVLKHKDNDKKTDLKQKLRDGANAIKKGVKGAIYGANDLKWKAHDAAHFVKDTWKKRDDHNKRVRGIKDEEKSNEKKEKAKEQINKKIQAKNNSNTNSNTNGSSTRTNGNVTVHVHNHNDEHARKNAQARANAEQDREDFFKRVNAKPKDGEENKGESGETETKTTPQETPASKNTKNDSKNKNEKGQSGQLSFLDKKGKIKKQYIQKKEANKNNEESKQPVSKEASNNKKAKAEEQLKLFNTKKYENKNANKNNEQSSDNNDDKDNKGSKNKPEGRQLKMFTAKGNVSKDFTKHLKDNAEQKRNNKNNGTKPADNGDGGEKPAENKNGGEKPNGSKKPSKIAEIPKENQASGRDLSGDPATHKLPPGDAQGSHSLQHVKTKGNEGSLFTDEKTGNDVPATPAEQHAKENATKTTRTPNRTIVVHKNKNNDNNNNQSNAEDNKNNKNKVEKTETNKTEEKTEVKTNSDNNSNTNNDNKKPEAEEKVEVKANGDNNNNNNNNNNNDSDDTQEKFNKIARASHAPEGQREKDKERAQQVGHTKGGKENPSNANDIRRHNDEIKYDSKKTKTINKKKKKEIEHGNETTAAGVKHLQNQVAMAKKHPDKLPKGVTPQDVENKVKDMYKTRVFDREANRNVEQESREDKINRLKETRKKQIAKKKEANKEEKKGKKKISIKIGKNKD